MPTESPNIEFKESWRDDNEVGGQIGYVSRKLGINRIQAVVLALMVNRKKF